MSKQQVQLKEKELSIEDLAPYLPYGLKVIADGERLPLPVYGMLKKLLVGGGTDLIFFGVSGELRYSAKLYKPLLRPMADLLDKPEFVEINHFLDLEFNSKGKLAIDLRDTDTWELKQFVLFPTILFQNHFDVFDLIGHGLALDINFTNG